MNKYVREIFVYLFRKYIVFVSAYLIYWAAPLFHPSLLPPVACHSV